ncbi:SDR family oxidoreductase [Corynebacterium halotolerans]|uniref:Short-chain dehydrogenase n=1 Tax=Corynebacterium halotolerans YIM 70093 = DSM 44683 TaxID=1121362 RepID=M1NP21_9CORY|nr:SDR family oxidoreductase [Corynebacterium halotolerans]AGF71252.1 short-chain dehydrogenase [Corynebacterium halotolerans YIM 70093 = DSM 44683]
MRVRDSVIVITGASSGIGRASATAFAGAGARAVVLVARREEALREVAGACESSGAETLVAALDITDAEAVTALARDVVDRFGRVDVWVNNAAVHLFGTVEEVPLEDFRRVLEVDILGYVHGARAVLPHMRAQGRGVLVNVASVAGGIPQPYAAAYSMAKSAVRALSGSLRSELRLAGHTDIHVTAVLPASVDTPLFQQAGNHTGREVVPMPPVYSVERAARAILGVVRRPRREVVVGPLGRLMLLQSKVAPGLTEKMMAVQVDRTHLSRSRPAGATHGNLFTPSEDGRNRSADGGWGGRRRTARRRLLGGTVLLGGVLAVKRLLR